MSEQPLLTPYHSDKLILKNRVVLAPMTRARADNEGNVPTDLMVTYYTQRASAGLLISEGAFVSPQAVGYINVPGIYSQAQVAGWKKITDAVHAQGNLFFAQLWHVGRLSHPDMLNGNLPLAPSAINAHDNVYTPSGFLPTVTPAAMTVAQIKQTVADFAQAAQNALAAGFDGVELHAANAYLFHQFFAQCANTRADEYGGSRENRARFLFEVLEAMQTADVDLSKVGVRLNPSLDGLGGITVDAETLPTFDYIVQRLNDYGLAYLHLLEPFTDVSQNALAESHIARRYRPLYQGTLIINNGFDQEKGNTILADGEADLVAFGKPFIANPDLVARFAQHTPLAKPDKETLYTPGPKGYTDYPALAEPVPH
ncbi:MULTISPECIES: alkene reductase [Spirosoma]|uniref:Alkene reductase n=1 Tax=Spirosoma liriopis TaxID=2937440 RepID=A0ABT0HUJ7_9BACT|nr:MULTISPECIES: alkene reductase [Spirosoma]MCK8495517.1 alkene reductase [Spirosoma liriopis]UHG94529.1 alkene reductase [Spirosoma oryzicola]